MHRCLWVSLVVVGLASCSGEKGRPVFPVGGHVLVAGQPAVEAVLTFLPVDMPPDGQTLEMIKARVEADGSFRPITYSRPTNTPRSGMPAGEYVVTIEWEDEDGHDRLQGRYADPKTTPLRVSITGSTELPPFELTTDPR